MGRTWASIGTLDKRPLVLAVAAVVGIGGSVRPLESLLQRPAADGPAAWADKVYAPLQARLEAGQRIGVLIAAGDPDHAFALHFAAQYALVPAVVEPIYLRDCLGQGSGKHCRLGAVDRIAFASTEPWAVASVSKRLGLEQFERVGGVALLRKTTR